MSYFLRTVRKFGGVKIHKYAKKSFASNIKPPSFWGRHECLCINIQLVDKEYFFHALAQASIIYKNHHIHTLSSYINNH